MITDEVPDSHHDEITRLSQNGDDVAALRLAQQDVDTYVAAFGMRDLHTANAINLLGCIRQHHGDLADAAASYEQACAIFADLDRSQEQLQFLMMSLCNLGEVRCLIGDGHRASEVLRRAHHLSSEVGTDPRLKGAILAHLGAAAELEGDLETAERLLRDGITIVRSVASTEAQEREIQERLTAVLESRGEQARQSN